MWKKGGCCLVLPCICLFMAVLIFAIQAGLLVFSVSPFSASPSSSSHHTSSSPSFSSFLYSMLSPSSSTNTNVSPVASLQAGLCTCSFQLLELLHAPTSSQNAIDCRCPYVSSTSNTTNCTTLKVQKKLNLPQPCPEQQKEQVQVVNMIEEPWYAKDKSWHYPARFPRCTMDACFNYSRCENLTRLRVYTYAEPAPPDRFFTGMIGSKWHTDDPDEACLFFVFLDTPGIYRSDMHPSELPNWNGGLNHVLISFADKWLAKGPNPESIGHASTMTPVMHQSMVRPGFDVSIPLPPGRRFDELQSLKPDQRKYLATFRGLRYLRGDGMLRSHGSFRGMHNGEDVVVATSCRHRANDPVRAVDAEAAAECEQDEAVYNSYGFEDLMNTTFGLAPAGRQPCSYRFAEVLSAGAIPVLITDNYVKPFEGLVTWHACVLEFPSSQMHRIVPALRAMSKPELLARQRYCLQIYVQRFKDDHALLTSTMEAQEARFMGAFPKWLDDIDDDIPHT